MGRRTIIFRSVVAASTAAIIVAGSIYIVKGGPPAGRGELNGNFFGLLATALLPTLIYLVGVFKPRSVVTFGLWLLVGTLSGWIFVVDDDAMRAVGTVLAFGLTFGTSLIGVLHDQFHRRDG